MGDKKVIIITGANSGIGKVTALELAKGGDEIVMVCRDKARGEAALLEIKKATGNEHLHLMPCDLSSLSDVSRFAYEFKNKFKRLDVLINNAGVMQHERKETIDGYELHFQVNYLSPFLLTHLLIDKMKPGGRIINVSSLAHRMGKIQFDDLNFKKGFSMFKAYGQSKLALVLFTYELSKKLESQGITVNCLHPGIIVSNLGIYKDKKFINQMTYKLKRLFTSIEKGAETSIYLASSDNVSHLTGKYFYKKKVKKSSRRSNDLNLAKKLWEVTERLLEINIDEQKIG